MLCIDKYIEVKKETPRDYIKISKQSAQTNKDYPTSSKISLKLQYNLAAIKNITIIWNWVQQTMVKCPCHRMRKFQHMTSKNPHEPKENDKGI